MYNKLMKKISVLLIFTLLLGLNTPSYSGVISNYKANIEQKRIYNNNINSIKKLLIVQDKFANAHNLEDLQKLYSKNYVSSDGFDYETSFKMVQETWETYPDISYSTDVKSIRISDNYATALVEETAIAAPKENFGDYETVGELVSKSRCVYHFEKKGQKWLIGSETIIDEISTLKFGEARYVKMELQSPKQIGAGKLYTTTLKVDAQPDSILVGSISQKKMVFPTEESKDVFRRINGNTLERVFQANNNNVNESVVASVGFTHTENYDESKIKVYLTGLGFIMTRVNVIPENKYIKVTDGQNK